MLASNGPSQILDDWLPTQARVTYKRYAHKTAIGSEPRRIMLFTRTKKRREKIDGGNAGKQPRKCSLSAGLSSAPRTLWTKPSDAGSSWFSTEWPGQGYVAGQGYVTIALVAAYCACQFLSSVLRNALRQCVLKHTLPLKSTGTSFEGDCVVTERILKQYSREVRFRTDEPFSVVNHL